MVKIFFLYDYLIFFCSCSGFLDCLIDTDQPKIVELAKFHSLLQPNTNLKAL